MAYVGKISDEDVTVSFGRHGMPDFRCDLLPGKGFDSEEKITAAINAYKLSLRKNFSNPAAWLFGSWRAQTPQPVTVTSVTEDGKEAWVRDAKGERSKVQLAQLVSDKDALLAVMAKEKELQEQIKATWDALPRWSPQSAEK